MSSVGPALSTATSIRQELAQEQSSSPIPTSPNADPVVGGAAPNPLLPGAPEDRVTLSYALLPSTVLQDQLTRGAPRGTNLAALETSRNDTGRYDLLNSKSGSNPIAVASAQVNADGTPRTTKTAAVQASSVTAQEQLQQLDRTLQQLGINAQSVSLIRRVELLRLANDPAALQEYFQSSSSSLAPQGSSTTAVPATQSLVPARDSNGSTYGASNKSPKSSVHGTHLNVSA